MTKKILLSLSVLSSLLHFAACKPGVVGSKQRPFTMYFTPSVDAQKITTTADAVVEFVGKYVSQKLYQKDTGFYVKGAVPQSYIAIIEAFGTKKADFAALTTFSYILARDIKKYDMEAVLETLRNGTERTYKGQIIARADSGITKISDLKGKKFAFTDPASTSGYILPSKLLKDAKIELAGTIFAQKHDNVVMMVYQKQVDAGATYYSSPTLKVKDGKKVMEITDARARVKTQFPDIESKVKVIAYTMEIPNEPWVIRGTLLDDPTKNKELKEYVIEAMLAFAKTPNGIELLDLLASATGLLRIDDSEYAEIRKIILDASLDLEKIVSK